MKKIVLLVLALSGSALSAQELKPNSLQLNWGLGQLMRQDLNFSPLIHQKWSALNFGLIYERSGRLEQMALVKFGQYQPQAGESYDYQATFNTETRTALPHSFTMLDLQYGLGKKVLERNHFSLSTGLKSRNRLWSSSYQFGDSGSFGYYFSFGLDLWLKAKYQLNDKSELSGNVGLALFSYNCRNPYLSQDDWYFEDNLEHRGLRSFLNYINDGELQSWGSSQVFDFDISYYYRLSPKWQLGASYWLSLNFNQSPTPLNSVENLIYLVGKYNF